MQFSFGTLVSLIPMIREVLSFQRRCFCSLLLWFGTLDIHVRTALRVEREREGEMLLASVIHFDALFMQEEQFSLTRSDETCLFSINCASIFVNTTAATATILTFLYDWYLCLVSGENNPTRSNSHLNAPYSQSNCTQLPLLRQFNTASTACLPLPFHHRHITEHVFRTKQDC